jgi:tripartite-type tricarboxylate transporter receptor subunit TctC
MMPAVRNEIPVAVAGGGIGGLAYTLALSLWALSPGGAAEQSYPDHTLKIVVPSAPAGGYDVVGRLLADQLSKRLVQNVIVENRPGAGTIVGTQFVVDSPADGYTLLIGGLSNIIFNAGLYKNLRHDPMRDLVPLALPFNLSYSLVGSKQSPYVTPQQIIDAAKATPGKLTLANAGRGTGQHILGAAFIKITGTQMLEVPYRGSTAVYPDLLSGRVDLFVDSTTAALPYVKSGQVNGIAILAARRSPHAPDLPTMTEAGVLGLEIDGWVGLFAPAKTPPNAIARLQREIANAMPELKPRFEAAGGEPMEVPPERLQSYLQADYDKWIKIIRDADIRLE